MSAMRDFAAAVSDLGNALADGRSDEEYRANVEARAEAAFARLVAEAGGQAAK